MIDCIFLNPLIVQQGRHMTEGELKTLSGGRAVKDLLRYTTKKFGLMVRFLNMKGLIT